MGDLLETYVSETLAEINDIYVEEGKNQRFTIVVKPSDYRRMEYVIDKLGKSKSEFGADAIRLLVTEFEKKLGVLEVVEGPEGDEELKWTDSYFQNVMFPDNKALQAELGSGFSYQSEGGEKE